MTKSNLSLKERFMKYVQRPSNPDDCWEWTGAKRDGYGLFGIDYKMYGAHRISYALFVDMIPDGMEVCHSCDNRACVNPSHLWIGTNQDNVKDRNNKNRQSKGEKVGTHKLTEQEIRRIRELIEQGYTNIEIAGMFKVSQVTISQIKVCKTWKWLK